MLNELITRMANRLLEKRWQLVTAESCTGGLVAASLTDIPGSSHWFERGFITYSNLSKEQMLGVPAALLEAHGAVSEPVALAMAQGALAHSAAHIAVSVTGIAGPGGGTKQKPVGLVCFGLAVKNGVSQALSCQFSGTRINIREAACSQSIALVLDILENQ